MFFASCVQVDSGVRIVLCSEMNLSKRNHLRGTDQVVAKDFLPGSDQVNVGVGVGLGIFHTRELALHAHL